MDKTAQSGEIVLHKTEHEPNKYSLRLNQNKCIHIQMNAIERTHFREGNAVPIQTQADYLGGRIKNTGDHKAELQHRITATWATLRKLDLLWGKSTASIKWKIKVYDAVIVADLMYGLASVPLTKADGRSIDVFQMKGFRKILNFKTLIGLGYPTRNYVLERVNVKLKGEIENKELRRPSTRLIERQIVLYAHIIRSDEDDPMKKISVTEQGERGKADFRRAGRPRFQWYGTAKGQYHNNIEKGKHFE